VPQRVSGKKKISTTGTEAGNYRDGSGKLPGRKRETSGKQAGNPAMKCRKCFNFNIIKQTTAENGQSKTLHLLPTSES
jgi:hypothetical protein